jgi:hypothetical protein
MTSKQRKRKLYRLRGRFVSKQEYEAGKALEKQAKQERKKAPIPKSFTGLRRPKGKPKDSKGKYVKETKRKSALDILIPKSTKQRTETLLSQLDFGHLPNPDVRREYTDPSGRGQSIHRAEYRFHGLIGHDMTVSLLQLLVIESVNDITIRSRVIISYKHKNKLYATSSRTDVPQRTLEYLEYWEGRPSAQEIFEAIQNGEGKLTFDTIVLSSRLLNAQQSSINQTVTSPKRRRNSKAHSSTTKILKSKHGRSSSNPKGGKTKSSNKRSVSHSGRSKGRSNKSSTRKRGR